jgi:hypothetical protein
MKHVTTGLALLILIALGLAPVVAAGPAKTDWPQAGYEGQHTMAGTVTSIDKKAGMMGLKTDEGQLMLHFPPDRIKNISNGERVTVELGIKPETSPSASPSSSSSSGSSNKK